MRLIFRDADGVLCAVEAVSVEVMTCPRGSFGLHVYDGNEHCYQPLAGASKTTAENALRHLYEYGTMPDDMR